MNKDELNFYYKLAFQQSPVGQICVKASDKTIFDINSSAIDMFGLTLDNVDNIEVSKNKSLEEVLDASERWNKIKKDSNKDQIINFDKLPERRKTVKLYETDGKLSIKATIACDSGFKKYVISFHDMLEFSNWDKQTLEEKKKLEELAYMDSLTGVANRTYFKKELNSQILKTQRSMEGFYLLFGDINGLKIINDGKGGHAAGDFAIKKTAKIIRESIRESDLIARLGGDEFVVILYNVTKFDDVKKIAKNIMSRFDKTFLFDGIKINFGISIGATEYIPSNFKSNSETISERIIKHADGAMYKAKKINKAYDAQVLVHNINGIPPNSIVW